MVAKFWMTPLRLASSEISAGRRSTECQGRSHDRCASRLVSTPRSRNGCLLERAWARARGGEANAKPWSWADTSPIARLEFPQHRASFIVLSGTSGRTMAWGPGHVDGTALPNAIGNCVIPAHRDTQFSVLRNVRIGEEIVLESRDGARIHYRVTQCRRTTDRDLALFAPSPGRRLTLITCYPFDAVALGGKGRWAVVGEE